MQQLPQIRAAYDWFFQRWQAEAAQAATANDFAQLAQLEEKRDALERETFVLMFGQFEKAVNDVFRTALASRSANPDWTRRRGWDADALADRKFPFETKLAMVLDKHAPCFRRVLKHYGTRNHCAHGGKT